MSQTTVDEVATAALTRAVHLPPRPRLPKLAQAVAFSLSRRRTVDWLARRYGEVFVLDLPVFGKTVTVADPLLAKQLFTANTDDVGNVQPNLSRILGSGSVFALDGADHRLRRKLLTPPFHGKSVKNYEKIFQEETVRETAKWPQGQEFETLEPMMRITLNAILRAVFGADGEQLDALRRIIPPWVTLGSRLAVLPVPSRTYGRYSPWGRLAAYRRKYDAVIDRLIDTVKADPDFEARGDVLTLLLRSTYEDGSAMSRRDIADELLTLLAAGHETTASTLAWVFERVIRHPDVLAKLEAEAATDGNEYRQAAILEVQRVRTVIDFSGRHVYAPTFQLGDWVIPRGHRSWSPSRTFTNARTNSPIRSASTRSASSEAGPRRRFIPYGGGTRRCVGAVFANVEMDVVLRTVLRNFAIETSTAPDEKVHSRGVAYTPAAGGRMVMRRRVTPLA